MSQGKRRVVVAGATGIAGRAACAAFLDAGFDVVALDSHQGRLDQLAADFPAADARLCELADYAAVQELSSSLDGVDGLIHLVGGWRGGDGLLGQSDDDWKFLSTGLIDTLRNTTRAFHDQLLAAEAGRVVIVSATAAAAPTAGNANYATAKAASEAWVAAVADSFRKAQSGRKVDPLPQRAAAVTFVIKALVTDEQKNAEPTRPFAGYTNVTQVAVAAVGLWGGDAATLNGAKISLVP